MELKKTSDGGETWYDVYPYMPIYGGYVYSIHFPTPLIGYASCSLGTVLKSTDGGETWTATTSELMLDLRDIFFVNADTGFVAGSDGYFARTFNGGMYWEDFNHPTITGKHLYFTDHLNGYAIEGDNLMKTIDGGETWTMVGMSEIGSYAFTDPDRVFGVGYHGRLFKSEDGGVTSHNYTTALTEEWFVDIQFPDENTGYAITDWPGQVVKTTDAGNTWEIVNTGTFNRLYSVWFTDTSTGFLTNGSELYKSTDGGYNWTAVTGTQWKGYLQKIFFVDAQTGYVSGEMDGVLYKTTDGGSTWDEIYFDEYIWPRDIYFVNEDLGYIAAAYSVLKTSDGGETYTESPFPNDNFFLSISFPSENTGFVGGFMGRLFKTTDGGQSWTELVDSTRIYPVVELFFINEKIGYMAAGPLYQTNDGGETWVEIPYVYGDRIWFNNEMDGFIVGMSGNIFKTINAGAVPVKNPVKPESIYTIFPNPSSGLLTIKNHAYKTSEFLKVSVYTSTGSMVFSGQYNDPFIQLDLRDYPSGLYFVRIQDREVKKVVIY